MQDQFQGRSRIRAIVILVVVLVVMAIFAILPHVIADHSLAALEKRQPILSSLERQVRRLNIVGESGDIDAAEQLERRILVQGSTAGIASANLQKMLQNLARRYRGQVNSFQVQTPKDVKDLRNVSMVLAARFEIKGLRDFIYAVETGEPFLFIDRVFVQRRSNTHETGKSSRRQLLDVTIEVSGFLLGDETT